MNPQLVTPVLTLVIMGVGVWVMFRGGRGRPPDSPRLPARFDAVVAPVFLAAMALQFMGGRVNAGALQPTTALGGAAVLAALLAVVPGAKHLVSAAALGVFLIENYGTFGPMIFAWLVAVIALFLMVSVFRNR